MSLKVKIQNTIKAALVIPKLLKYGFFFVNVATSYGSYIILLGSSDTVVYLCIIFACMHSIFAQPG